jgi:serine/threonine-protein kinase PpkA
MEYLAGGDLKNLLGGGRLAPEDALRIAGQVAGALGHAHGKGFVHRDVKPENILFRHDGSVVLTDFGIARAIGGSTRLTRAGASIGTPHYMSPEQATGKAEIDGRSDLYSLGVVLYEMLTGDLPYQSEDTFAVALMHVNDPPPMLPSALADYQPLLDGVMAKNPEKRHADAASFVRALQTGKLEGLTPPKVTRQRSAPNRAVGGGQSSPTTGEFKVGPAAWGIAGGLLGLLIIVGLWAANRPHHRPFGMSDGMARASQREEDRRAAELRRFAQSQERITDLLAAANAALAERRLAEPAGENALELYRQVLQLEESNEEARQGLSKIVEQYLALADEAGSHKKFDAARHYLALASEVLPGSSAISEAGERLERLVEASRFKRRAAFSSDTDYVRYLRENLRPGMKVKALSALKHGEIPKGLTGTFAGSNEGYPPCLVVWDKNLGTNVSVLDNVSETYRSHAFWVQWQDIEIVN